MSRFLAVTSLFALSLSPFAPAQDKPIRPDAVMLRTPDVSRDSIVFRYAGDLWLVDKQGGIARSLSSPAGLATNPKFSPDGKQIAFMAGYDGGSDIYVLSIDGGIPLRVTHHPDREVLCDWDPNGKDLIFFSSQVSGQQRAPKLFRVAAAGGQPAPLPVPYGVHGAIDETGTWLAYCPQSWALNASWKRYQGARRGHLALQPQDQRIEAHDHVAGDRRDPDVAWKAGRVLVGPRAEHAAQHLVVRHAVGGDHAADELRERCSLSVGWPRRHRLRERRAAVALRVRERQERPGRRPDSRQIARRCARARSIAHRSPTTRRPAPRRSAPWSRRGARSSRSQRKTA